MDLALGELSGVGLMVREGVTARSPYRVNLEHELVQRVLIPLFAGEQTYVDAQFDALRVLIEESWRGRARFLYWGGVFGSVARGEETSDSDLDLAMIIDTPDQVSAVHDSASIAASVFSRRFGRRVSPLILSRPQFARLAAAGELLAEGLVRDGRRLAGEGDLTRMARGEAD
ncbi:MAG: nucleotidyltransferase domain-containing protein [Gemmatimonadales bacterium]